MLPRAIVVLLLTAVTAQELCLWTSHTICFKTQPNVSYNRKCPTNFVYALYDFHQMPNVYGKVVTILCVKTGDYDDCRTSGPLNALGRAFKFRCHIDAVITQIKYDHDNAMQDGVFTIECCKIRGRRLSSCTPWDESTGFEQFKQAGAVGLINGRPHPGIGGLATAPMVVNFWGVPVKTRKYVIYMCYFK